MRIARKAVIPAGIALTALGAAPAAMAATTSVPPTHRALIHDTPDAVGVRPLTATRSACSGGSFFGDTCLHMTITGSKNDVGEFEGEACVSDGTEGPVSFSGHIQLTGPGGFSKSTLGHMAVTESIPFKTACTTKTLTENKDMTPGTYREKLWRNNGNNNFTMLASTYVNVLS
jgi:hypothetical protein